MFLLDKKWTASSEFGTYRLCEQRRFGRACASAVKICHDGMLKDTNSLDGAQMILSRDKTLTTKKGHNSVITWPIKTCHNPDLELGSIVSNHMQNLVEIHQFLLKILDKNKILQTINIRGVIIKFESFRNMVFIYEYIFIHETPCRSIYGTNRTWSFVMDK